MNPTIDILRAELERLFSLDEMTSMSQRLLGLDPIDVGGATAKASFAQALTERWSTSSSSPARGSTRASATWRASTAGRR